MLGVGCSFGTNSAAAAYNWSGCYVGLEGGGVWGNSQSYSENPASMFFGLASTIGIRTTGGLFGATTGCNYQFTNWILGIENDFSWTDNSGTASGAYPFSSATTYQTKETWLETLRARFGFAWDRWFFYGTGGGGLTAEGTVLCNPVPGCGSRSKTTLGWSAGVGAEYAVWGAWSVKVEYLHVDFGRSAFQNITATNPTFYFVPHDVTLVDEIFRVGANYKFNLFGWTNR